MPEIASVRRWTNVNQNVYDDPMGYVTQVAFQLDDASLAALDSAASASASSRAEVLRTAVREYLTRRREVAIDAQLAAGYAAIPQGADEIAAADFAVEGLAAGDLDW